MVLSPTSSVFARPFFFYGATNMIKGGYILQPRIIDGSESSQFPPVTRELWAYLLRKVNHARNDRLNLDRGQGFFQLSEIQNDLSWYSGYRKNIYSKPQLTKSLRRLREGNMVATAKATRGLIITICNYDYYQDPKNYEGNDEGSTKVSRRKRQGHTINKNVKNDKKKKLKDSNNLVEKAPLLNGEVGDIFTYWKKELNHPRAKLDDKRKKKITALLKIGYTIEDLKTAIDGCKKSPFHQGQNKRQSVYDDIELICRDASHVDRFIKTASLAGGINTLSEFGKRAVEVSKSWLEKNDEQ